MCRTFEPATNPPGLGLRSRACGIALAWCAQAQTVEILDSTLMTFISMHIRRAQPDDAATLTGIAFTAKRHWGYPERWIEGWRDALTVRPEFIVNDINTHGDSVRTTQDRRGHERAVLGKGADLLRKFELAQGCHSL